MVFCGVYPIDATINTTISRKRWKNCASTTPLSWEPETSTALGFGFRCGFLGLLHMDVVQERLEREYNLNLITTAPSVIYKITQTDGREPARQSRQDARTRSDHSRSRSPSSR